ncbi:SDR family oxidoreductase [Nocardioides sp.]|uniref:SDR family oxidoreductase n=1 Tax=Nocardioides sp. TaxID=35761 RepID=UPI0039E3A795
MDAPHRTALVTGAASGIGRATAEELAARGYAVLALDIDEPGLAELVASAEGAGGTIRTRRVDVSDQDAVRRAVTEEVAGSERLDAVVNCAASFVASGLEVTTEEWELALGVNVRGISNVVQAAHPYLARTPGAAVVNTASISARIAQPSRWTYNATKGAIVSLTRCMAMDLAVDGIRVNSVSPGWIWTPEVARAAAGDRERWEPIWGRFHLLRRLGEPVEVARAIAFLCSAEASFITGTDLPVDGGYLAMGPEGLGDDSTFAGTS